MLREEGLEVSYTPSMEERGGGQVVADAVVSIAAAGAVEAVRAAVARFKARLPRALTWVDGEEVTITEDEPAIRIVEDEGP